MASSMRPAMERIGILCRNSTRWPMLRNFMPATRLVRNQQLSTNCFRVPSHNLRYGSAKALGGAAAAGTLWCFFGFSFKKKDLSEEDQIRELVSEGIVKKDKGNIEGASKAFHEALKLSSEFLTDNKINKKDNMNHRVYIYDQIANMSMEMGQFKNAEDLFKETMKLALTLGMDRNDNAIIEMSLKLAMIFLYTGRTDLAHQGLQHCIKEQERKVEAMKEKEKEAEPEKPISPEEKKKAKEEAANTKILLGKAYKNYANSFLQSRDFKKAEPLIVKSYDISVAELGPQHDTTFVIMNDLATCLIMLKKYEDAEKLLVDGIKSSKKVESVLESALSSNLGALYIRTGRYDEAETVCAKGLSVAKKFKDDYFMGPCKACMAKLQQLRDMKKKAENDENDD